MIGDSDIELIEKYLEGVLSNQELLAFNKRMENDSQFKNEVELQRLTILAIQKKGRSELKEKLKSITNNKEQITIDWYKKLPFKILAAASVILILFVGIYFLLENNKKEKGFVKNENNEIDKDTSKLFYGNSITKNSTCGIKIILKGSASTDSIFLSAGKYSSLDDSLKVSNWSAIFVDDSVTLALYSDVKFQNLILGKINGPFQVNDHDTINMKYLSDHHHGNARMEIELSKTKSLEIVCHKKGNLIDKIKDISY